jgi:anti-repressor protein
MNALALSGAATMTSKEMADLTEKRHDSVKRTIETLAARGAISRPQIVDGERSANGVVEKLYLIGKRDSYVIVAQLSPEFTARLVDRWQELEAAAPALNLRQPAQMLAVTMQLAEMVQEQQAQLTAQAPKVDFANAVMNADGTTLVRDVAKTFGVGVRKLEKALRLKGVILPNNAPAAAYVSKGYFKEATHTFETNTKGTQLSHTARVTGLGIEFLRRFVVRHSDLLGGAH